MQISYKFLKLIIYYENQILYSKCSITWFWLLNIVYIVICTIINFCLTCDLYVSCMITSHYWIIWMAQVHVCIQLRTVGNILTVEGLGLIRFRCLSLRRCWTMLRCHKTWLYSWWCLLLTRTMDIDQLYDMSWHCLMPFWRPTLKSHET